MTGSRRLSARLLRALRRGLGYGVAHDSLVAKVRHSNPDSWIAGRLVGGVPQMPEGQWSVRIEERAEVTQRLGERPLWSRYPPADAGRQGPATRCSDQVRTSPRMGRFFTWLVAARRPMTITEFGAAFGVSGMYWLSGLEMNSEGWLHTFEPNEDWASIAEANLRVVGSRFTLTRGTFEDNIALVLPRGQHIDIAFIDAIHTSAFVEPQFNLVAERLAPGGLVLLDDIDFSVDMQACWRRIREDGRLAASAEVGRVGIVELSGP